MLRRSICIAEPQAVRAGEVGTWRFCYTTANDLPKGAKLRFDMLSKGRPTDWQIPDAQLKNKTNTIYALMPNGQALSMKEIELPSGLRAQYECTLPAVVEAGETLVFVLGAAPGCDPIDHGSRAQTCIQRRRPFFLYIDPKGNGNFAKEPEVFQIDIRGGRLHNIRVLVPSFVARNKRFDVTIRFEDEFGNLTGNAPENTLIDLSYEHLRENLNWKLFVPETGFVVLPNLYFNEPGVYRIQLTNLNTKDRFFSAPIKCFGESDLQLFWGLLHGEAEQVDSLENIETCIRHFRDDQDLHFFAYSGFESNDETPPESWKQICNHIADFNEEDRMTTFLGFQWHGTAGEEGLRHIIYAKDQKPLLRQKDAKFSALKKIYKSFSPKELISIPSFSMGKDTLYNFEDFSPEFERVVEIYNAWGCSEGTSQEGNLRPIKGKGKGAIVEDPTGSIIQALKKGKRFGFVAGGLDDRGVYEPLYAADQEQYSPGLTGIIAKAHNRESLFDALYNRRCYATTGERMLIGLNIAGSEMGSEIKVSTKPGLVVNRHISGFAVGTKPLKSIELIRNGEVFQKFKPTSDRFEFEYDDLEPLGEVCIEDTIPFTFYFLKVTQEDGNIAWSSPIWVDYDKEAAIEQRALNKKTVKGKK